MTTVSFPRKIATGDEFCNRVMEKQRLKDNIARNHHSLLISPRRYGKTSLVFTIAHELTLPFVHTQFLNAFKYETITLRLTQCLTDLMQQVFTPSQKTLNVIQSFFTKIKVGLKINNLGMSFQLEPMDREPEKVINALLSGIEKLLVNRKKKAIIFLDEFQDIAIADETMELQSLLRDFAQRTKHIIFIISGSNRKLLESMFNDRNKPFYKLFDHIKLTRIDTEHYYQFLNEKAKLRWKKTLSEALIDEILFYTENHAYYTNRLCDELWQNDQMPSDESIKNSWDNVLQSEFDTVAEDLSRLTKNQRIVLQEIAKLNYVTEPSSSQMVAQVGLGHASILNAIEVLEKQDYIEKTEKGYRVIDPAIKFILKQ